MNASGLLFRYGFLPRIFGRVVSFQGGGNFPGPLGVGMRRQLNMSNARSDQWDMHSLGNCRNVSSEIDMRIHCA